MFQFKKSNRLTTIGKRVIITGMALGILSSTSMGMTYSPFAKRHTRDTKIYGTAWFNSGYKTTKADSKYGVKKDKYIKQCWVRVKEGGYDEKKWSESFTRKEKKQGYVHLEKWNNPFFNATITWGWKYN